MIAGPTEVFESDLQPLVTPAKAGVQRRAAPAKKQDWIPAFAGMTKRART
jgi:hypothetical protein